MKKSFTLDLKEITTILINVIYVKLFFIFPKRIILNAGNAAWIQIVYVSLLVILLYYLFFAFYKKSGNMSVIELSEKIGGNAFKIIVGIIVSIALFFNLASTIRSFPEMVKMVLLPNTPIEFILIIFSVVVASAAYFGLDSIARIHSIFIPIVLGILVVFFVFLLPHIKIYNIFPILGKGSFNIFVKGVESIDLFDDLLILNLLLPYVRNMEDAKKSGIRAIIISSVIAMLIVLIYCLVYPYPSSQKFIVPIYQLTRLVGIGDFFQRFEAFFEFIWSFSILLYAALYLLVICMVWRDSFNLKYEKPIIFPMIAVTTIIGFSSNNIQEFIFGYRYFTIYVILTAFALPVILSFIYNRKMKRK